MFEWNWDSVAAECTSFLGPAGYGYVQGERFEAHGCARVSYADPYLSEPCAGTHPGPPMVDGLPTCLVHHHVETRHAGAVREHDPLLPRSWRRGNCWFVEHIRVGLFTIR